MPTRARFAWPLLLVLSSCGHPPASPTSATPPAAAVRTVSRIQLVATPGELPIGGGTARIGIETNAGGAVAARVPVHLQATSGTLEFPDVVTDATGHAFVAWTGGTSTSVTATAGEIIGTLDLRVLTPSVIPPAVPPPSSPAPPSSPVPLPTPEPTLPPLVVTLRATNTTIAVNTAQVYTASVSGLIDENVRGYVWTFGEGTDGTATTVDPTRSFAYPTAGFKVPKVTVTTTNGRTESGTMNLTVTSAGPAPSVPVLTVTLNAPKSNIAVGEEQTYTATVTGLSDGETVVAYEWTFSGNAVEFTTLLGTRDYTYMTAGLHTAKVSVTTTSRTAAGTKTIVVPSSVR